MTNRSRRHFLRAAASVVVVSALPAYAHSGHVPAIARAMRGISPPKGLAIGGEFELLDQYNRPFRLGAKSDRRTLVLFGFTNCPHACPTVLAEILQIKQKLAPERIPRMVFVTLDPEHDTPGVLRQYVQAFDTRLIALTGAPQLIDAVANAYRVNYRRVPTEAGYTIEHSAYMYLLDHRGNLIRLYPQTINMDAIVTEINLLDTAREVMI